MTAWDQIIVTPPGKAVPKMNQELQDLDAMYGRSLERKGAVQAKGFAEYNKSVEELFRNINLKDTFTFCSWGASQWIDLLRWKFVLNDLVGQISMGRFFEDMPVHVCMYELEAGALEQCQNRHLESRKKYYMDFMFWSNAVECPSLPSRYAFVDAPKDLEDFSAAYIQASASGGRCPPSKEPREDVVQREVPRPVGANASTAHGGQKKSFLAAVSDRLRWIPSSACATSKSGCLSKP